VFLIYKVRVDRNQICQKDFIKKSSQCVEKLSIGKFSKHRDLKSTEQDEVFCFFLVARHFSEGLVQFVGYSFEFLFLVDQLICSECPERRPPFLLPFACFSPSSSASHLRACRPPFGASERTSRQILPWPQPASASLSRF